MKKIAFLILSILVAGTLIAGCGKNESKIAYIDMNRVIKEAPQVATLNKDFETKLSEIEKEKADLLQKRDTMKPEEFQQKAMAITQKEQSIQMGIQTQFANLIEPVYIQISEEKDLSVILNKVNSYSQKTVEYGGIDVTDDVIEKLK